MPTQLDAENSTKKEEVDREAKAKEVEEKAERVKQTKEKKAAAAKAAKEAKDKKAAEAKKAAEKKLADKQAAEKKASSKKPVVKKEEEEDKEPAKKAAKKPAAKSKRKRTASSKVAEAMDDDDMPIVAAKQVKQVKQSPAPVIVEPVQVASDRDTFSIHDVEFFLPDSLYFHLREDMDRIVTKKQLLTLPRRPCLHQILVDFQKQNSEKVRKMLAEVAAEKARVIELQLEQAANATEGEELEKIELDHERIKALEASAKPVPSSDLIGFRELFNQCT